MQWFGETWGAPVCEPEDHAETPVGERCLYCNAPIEAGDQGVLIPLATLDAAEPVVRTIPQHVDCLVRSMAPCLLAKGEDGEPRCLVHDKKLAAEAVLQRRTRAAPRVTS